MAKIIVIYSFEKINPTERKKFHRKLFGSVEKTHGGRYSVEIKGVLSETHVKRPVKAIFIVDSNFKNKIKTVLEEFSAKFWIYQIS